MTQDRLEMCEDALRQMEEVDRRFPDEPAIISVTNQLRYLIRDRAGRES